MMRVVDRYSVDALPAREQLVPDLLHSRRATTAVVVDQRMTVVYLDQLVVPDPCQNVSRNCPAEVGMIDVRDSVDFAHRVDVPLNRFLKSRAGPRCDHGWNIESVDVHRVPVELARHLFSRDQEKCRIHQVRELRRVDPHIMVRDHEEMVTVTLVPSRHDFRRRVPVTLERVCVSVSLQPFSSLKITPLELRALS